MSATPDDQRLARPDLGRMSWQEEGRRGDPPPGVRGGVECEVRGLVLAVAVSADEQHLAARPHGVGIDPARSRGGRDVAPLSGARVKRVAVARRSAGAGNGTAQRYELVARPGK